MATAGAAGRQQTQVHAKTLTHSAAQVSQMLLRFAESVMTNFTWSLSFRQNEQAGRRSGLCSRPRRGSRSAAVGGLPRLARPRPGFASTIAIRAC